MIRERELELLYPWIDWREPVQINTTSGSSGLGCRFCTALRGLKGSEVLKLPQTPEEFENHMKTVHFPEERKEMIQ